jgi:hypothetical protein
MAIEIEAPPRFYADFDGVFGALYADRVWPFVERSDVIIDGGHRIPVVWAPGLVRAVDGLCAEFGLEIVWVTSWCEDDAIRRQFVPMINGLRSARALPYSPEDGSGEWKLRAIIRDQERSPSPFIWADDVEVAVHGSSLPVGVPQLLVAPRTSFGLGPAHVALMRDWLVENTAGR